MAVVARAPGKLYIAGEYAVVEPGRPAVLVAVDRYVTVTVTPTEGTGHIISDQTAPRALAWHRVGDDLVVDPEQSPSRFVLAAIQTVEEVARSLGVPLGVYDLRIDSELDDDSGRKFGLGSSAAVTVATVRALCAFHRLDLTRMEQFKLALLATLAVERSGSGGDVAASQFGGWIRYTAFDRERVRAERVARPAVELLREPWPGLGVARVVPPDRLRLLVGWTGSPASTARLVDGVQARKRDRDVRYLAFLDDSTACVDALVAALEADDASGVRRAVRRNRELLRGLGEHAGITIETPALTRLIETAEASGGAAKTSGAGGGDCGIALIDRDRDIEALLAAWERADIRRLSLRVHPPEGVIDDAGDATAGGSLA